MAILVTTTNYDMTTIYYYTGKGHIPPPRSVLSAERSTDTHDESETTRDPQLLQTANRGYVQPPRITTIPDSLTTLEV